ncbi:MAG TPA: ATPase P [Cytophagales bacterium]|jgi:copper chaperone CopZ|nr:ATPase P [Cytophagales bacterium]
MKTLIISFLATALICGCSCKAAYGQTQEKPFGTVKTKVVELTVTGMTCQGCADHVTTALSKKAGVVKSDVQFTSNSATITYDPSTVKEEEIIQAIEETGYKAEAKTGTAKKELKKEDPTSHACCVPKKKN